MSGYRFVRSEAEYRNLHSILSRIVDMEARVPKQVFIPRYSYFGFDQTPFALSEEFFEVLRSLSAMSGDDSVLVASLDPDPETVFRRIHGYYPWAVMDMTTLTESAYGELMEHHPAGFVAEALRFSAHVIAWVPLSGRWCVWGERDWEVCVLGVHDARASRCRAARDTGPKAGWKDVEFIIEYLSSAFDDDLVTPNFASELRDNYGPSTRTDAEIQ